MGRLGWAGQGFVSWRCDHKRHHLEQEAPAQQRLSTQPFAFAGMSHLSKG